MIPSYDLAYNSNLDVHQPYPESHFNPASNFTSQAHSQHSRENSHRHSSAEEREASLRRESPGVRAMDTNYHSQNVLVTGMKSSIDNHNYKSLASSIRQPMHTKSSNYQSLRQLENTSQHTRVKNQQSMPGRRSKQIINLRSVPAPPKTQSASRPSHLARRGPYVRQGSEFPKIAAQYNNK